MERIPIIRRDADGTIIDGTCAVIYDGEGGGTVHDFRDLSGKPLELPPKSSFEFALELDPGDVQMVSPLIDPDSPHWMMARLPRRVRRRHEKLARRGLILVASGTRPDEDLEFCKMSAGLWADNVRLWRQAFIMWRAIIAAELGFVVFDVWFGLWLSAVFALVWLSITMAIVFKALPRKREMRREAQRQYAYYAERVKALS